MWIDKEKPAGIIWILAGFGAEKPGFEPGLRLSHTTPLAGEPLRPLGYFSKPFEYAQNQMEAEREGFEPPVPLSITSFQD